MRRPQYERELLEALRTGLESWRRDKSLNVLLAQPPWKLPPGVKITPRDVPHLPASGKRRQPPLLARWPEHGVHASQYPYLGYIVEGEADLRFGVTSEMARSIEDKDFSAVNVASLPAGTFFVVAPGVPYADGSTCHWERPHLERAYSRILWITVYPAGIALHACLTRGTSHLPSSSIFVWDSRALTMTSLLIEALQANSPQAQEIGEAHLGALLLHVEQEWLLGRTCPLNQTLLDELNQSAKEGREGAGHTGSMHESIVRRACDYVENHIATTLTLEDIAGHAFVSVAQLNRLFRAELNMSVMEFVIQRRLQTSQFLLRESELSISHVSILSGFKRSNYFSRIFLKHTGMTPSEYRREARVGE